MQPVKIRILGNFFDSQIYSGKLYLWHFGGRLSVYDWDQLIESIQTDDYLDFVIGLCLKDGSYLYQTFLYDKLIHDKEIGDVLQQKLNTLSGKEFVISEKELCDFLIKEYDVPLGEMPIDTTIYRNKLYYALDSGLYVSRVRGSKEAVSATKRPSKMFDGRVVHMSAGYNRIALSMLSDGLYEYNLWESSWKDPICLTSKHSNFAYYNYSNVFNSSLQGDSFMLYYPREDVQLKQENVHSLFDLDIATKEGRIINHDRTKYEQIGEDRIFSSPGKKRLGWGFNNRIYYADGKEISAVKFTGYDKKNMFHVLQSDYKENNARNEQIINASVAYFGNVVEYMSKLVVYQSDGALFEINEPITRWRVFNRSVNYENHLHVILDDSLCIYGFLHDYMRNERDKVMGAYFEGNKRNMI